MRKRTKKINQQVILLFTKSNSSEKKNKKIILKFNIKIQLKKLLNKQEKNVG